MLKVSGPSRLYCDGVRRRNFLTIGTLAATGLSLPKLIAAESAAGIPSSHRSVIMVYLAGGLSHQDTFDLKPDAPVGIKSDFNPIGTSVPGIHISDMLPRLAQSMHRYSVIRSLVGLRDEHTSFQNLTGFPMDQATRERIPNVGCVITRSLGQVDPVMPAYVDLFPTMQHRPYNIPGSGYLGRSSDGVKIENQTLDLMKLRDIDLSRLASRQTLRDSIDRFRQEVDSIDLAGVDNNYQRAYSVLTSSKLLRALDINCEPIAIQDRYGHGSQTHLGDGAPMWNDQLLAARRLVEAGARFVSVAYGFWDTHGNNFGHLRQHLPLFDQGISALINDVYDRGLDKEVMVVVWGEFGRTPKLNKDGGRDHWAPVNSAIIAGGGSRVGQTIGSTDALGAYALDRPIHYRDVLATIYRHLGIDSDSFLRDISNRPVPVLGGQHQPIREILG